MLRVANLVPANAVILAGLEQTIQFSVLEIPRSQIEEIEGIIGTPRFISGSYEEICIQAPEESGADEPDVEEEEKEDTFDMEDHQEVGVTKVWRQVQVVVKPGNEAKNHQITVHLSDDVELKITLEVVRPQVRGFDPAVVKTGHRRITLLGNNLEGCELISTNPEAVEVKGWDFNLGRLRVDLKCLSTGHHKFRVKTPEGKEIDTIHDHDQSLRITVSNQKPKGKLSAKGSWLALVVAVVIIVIIIALSI